MEHLDEQIKVMYLEDCIGSTSIARKLGISESTVRRRLSAMGVELRKPKKLNIDVIKADYLEGTPIYIIAKKYCSSETTISKLLRANGVTINHSGVPKFNQEVFDSIDTEEKAYWLGFIFADGYIATINPEKPNYAFELALKSEDYEHLNKFNLFMSYKGNNVKIGRGTCNGKAYERCRWSISNRHMWEVLNNYGCTPRKSNTLQFPNADIFKDKSLIRHFIRGYFDGDGGISFFDKKHIVPTAYISGTYDMLNEISKYLPLSVTIHSRSNSISTIDLSHRNAMLLLHYLYDNCSVYLNRKYNLFQSFCSLYEESYLNNEPKSEEGESPNTEINSETKESESSYSIEVETGNPE